MKFHLAMPETADRAYLVGGSVRDLLLEHRPQDYDIAVLRDPRRYAHDLAAMHRHRVVELGRGEKCIWRVVGKDAVFDVSGVKGASIEEDLKRRDFTINAMAWDMRSEDIVDVVGGLKDLNDKIIRMVSATTFQQDPVRLLRAYRMAAKTGFGIEARTAGAIAEKGFMIRRAAGERIRDEWFALLQYPVSAPVIRAMAASGFLLELFPEMAGLKGCVQNRHHENDGFVHTIDTFSHLENQLLSPERVFPRSAAALERLLPSKRRAVLKNAALLHDIGKPATATTDGQGRRHFFGHEKVGARMIADIGRRYKHSNHEIETTAFIVRHHLRPLFLFNQVKTADSTGRARARFFLACDDLVPDIVVHAVADSRGKSGRETQRHAAFAAFADRLLETYFTGYRPLKKGPPLLNGRDLMRIFGLGASPLIGTVLRQIQEARIAGRISTHEEAVDMAGGILKRQPAVRDDGSGADDKKGREAE